MDKRDLRSKYNKLRDEVAAHDRDEMSREITERLLGSNIYKNSKSIFCYCSMGSEVYTYDILKAALKDGKKVAVPKVLSNEGIMAAIKIENLDTLRPGRYNINEPCSNDEAKDVDLAIVPGLLFNKRGYRVGYGKGFYDRYLKGKNLLSIGICFEFQITDLDFQNEFDIPVDYICTEKSIYKVGGLHE